MMQMEAIKRGLRVAAAIFDDAAQGRKPEPLLCAGAAFALAGWYVIAEGECSRTIRKLAEEAGDVLHAYATDWKIPTPGGIVLARRLANQIQLLGEIA